MLRRLFRNRPPVDPTRAGGGEDPPRPDPPTVSPVDRLLGLPAELAAAEIRSVDDTELLIELALKDRGELRRQALEHPLLQHAPGLTALEKRSRDRDKSLNRHARRLLDRRKQLQHEADATRQRAEELAVALHRPDSGLRDRAWRERQHELHRRLDGALTAYAELRTALAEFGDRLEALETLRVDAGTLPSLDVPADPPAAAPPAAGSADPPSAGTMPNPGPAGEPFEPLVAEFEALDQAMTAGEPFAELAARRQSLTERWLTAADHRPPDEAQHAVFESVSHRYRELADAMQRLGEATVPDASGTPLALPEPGHGHPSRQLWDQVDARRQWVRQIDRAIRAVRWPDWAPPAPELVRLQDAARTLHAEIERAEALQRGELETLDQQIEALTQAIDEGSLARAQSLLGQVRARHDSLPANAVRQAGRRLGKQAARLAELKDWQTFATTPKRESLVDAMAELAAAPLAPRAQADRIKQLRQAWQGLGPVAQAVDGRLADRFNAEAEKAFEPCRAYFAELAEQRKANLTERIRICDQLERYLEDTDWRHADMKAAEKIMRAARDEWREFHPVDRNPGRKVEARFEQLQGRLHDYVKAEWDRNLQAKEALVEEARALLEDDLPMVEKTARAKTLQRRWREVGITPRRPDQRLWRAFREACDHIFAARDDARQAAGAALDTLQTRLTEILDAFEAGLTGLTAAAADPSALRAFHQQTADLDRLPAARRRPLADRRAALAERYAGLLEDQRRQAARARLADLERWDAEAAAAEAAGRPLTECTTAAPPSDPVLRERAARAGSEVPRDALRRLAVTAELSAGRASPAEDEALRMELQVERLQAGLSGGQVEPRGAIELAEAWCRLGPKDDTVAPLRERLFAALREL